MKFLISLCVASLAATAALAQSQPTMLSQSRYKIEPGGGAILVDSLTHSHSGGRVSYGLPVVSTSVSPGDGVYNADESIRVYSLGISSVDRMTRTFNSTGLITEYQEQKKAPGGFEEIFKEWYHYNQSQQLDTTWLSNASLSRRHTYIYQNGVQVAGIYENYNKQVNTWDPLGIDSFQANGTDSTYILYWGTGPGPFITHKYKRDANLRVVVDSFVDMNTLAHGIIYTDYDALGRKVRDSFVTPAVPQYKFDYKYNYVYDNSSNLVNRTKHIWNNTTNTYSEIISDSMTYNAVNQLTSVRSFTLSGSTWTPKTGSHSRFYYYGFPTSVADVADDKPLRLYPVPATSYINIDMSFSKPEKFTVRITDLQGRVVRQWDEAPQAGYKKHIELTGMTAGNYIMHISSENNNTTRRFSVIN